MRIAFIACSKTKRSEPCTAELMYQGSLFKKALAYCKPRFDKVCILSAKYGLLELTDCIEPYEVTLNTMSKQERYDWAKKVKQQLRSKKYYEYEQWFFTGERYCEHFSGIRPLEGLSLGFQLKWFTDNLANKPLKQKGFEL